MTVSDEAIVVGSGPNGLAAAITLAQAGLSVHVLEAAETLGGGMGTCELTIPGLLHDTCSAVHPFAAASPFLSRLPLAEHGLTWCYPEIDCAHPLDDGTVALLHRSLDSTAEGLGPDGPRWRAAFGPLTRKADDLVADALGPLVRVPRHPVAMAQLGLRAGLPATLLARAFRTEQARALFLGSAAHIWRPLDSPASSSVGAMMIAAGHRHGWPVVRGGSGELAAALVSCAKSLGVEFTTGIRVTSLTGLPQVSVLMFDTAPGAMADIAGDRLPARNSRAYRRFRHGPAAFKIDLAVDGGVPWRNPEVRRAGTVHIGGSARVMVEAERAVANCQMPERPFILLAQQHVADPTRSVGDIHPVYLYAHVPSGYDGDATETVLAEVERFAPGLRERILATSVTTPAQLEARNPNYVAGDIVGGSNTLRGLFARPVLRANPYATGIPGVYLCSASTPPGAGTHGMSGHLAAVRAIRHLVSKG